MTDKARKTGVRLAAFATAALTLLALPACSAPLPTEQMDIILPTLAPVSSPAAPIEPMVTATSEPTPTPEPVILKVRANKANFRSEPSAQDDSNILTELEYEQELTYIGEENGFTFASLADGTEGYISSELVVTSETPLYAYLPEETEQTTDKNGNPVTLVNQLVDLRLYLPNAQYELLFNTENNVIGEPLYGRSVPLMQRDCAMKLQKAWDIFLADGYTIKVYDAYRPKSVQRRLFEVVKNKHWIANPDTTASNHNRGCAVDMALLDANGQLLDFPTPMHTFANESARTSDTWTEEQRKNVDYMTGVMESCGFSCIESEWWHFSDLDKARYMTTDIDLTKLNMLPKQEG